MPLPIMNEYLFQAVHYPAKHCNPALMTRLRGPQRFGVTINVIAYGDAIQLVPLAPEVNPELCYCFYQPIGHLKVFQFAEVLIQG